MIKNKTILVTEAIGSFGKMIKTLLDEHNPKY